MRDDYLFVEPGSLSEIRDARPSGPCTFDIDLVEVQFKDRLHAAWQGRGAGCSLGKPTETVPTNRIWKLLEEIDAFPLADYLPADLIDERQETVSLGAIPSHNRTYADAVDTSLSTRPRARISTLAEDTWDLHQAIQTDSSGRS